MGKSRLFCVALMITLLFAINAGCSLHTNTTSKTFSKGRTYKNDDFGIFLRIPDNWDVRKKKDIEETREKAIKTHITDEQKKEDALEAAKHTITLISMKQHHSTTSEFASFSCSVEKLDRYPELKNSREYLLGMKKRLEEVGIISEKEIYTEKIDGMDFDVWESKTRQPDNKILYYKTYAAFIKDNIYFIVLGYVQQDDLKTLQEIIQSIKITK